MTEIILREDVENVGSTGEVVDVAPGYARNYLLPQGFAMPATEGNLRRLEEERRHEEAAEAHELERAQSLAEELEGRSVTFTVRAGDEGQLFGSVTSSDIADRLAEEGLHVDRRRIELEEAIKELGVYRIAVDLHEEFAPELKIWVVAEE